MLLLDRGLGDGALLADGTLLTDLLTGLLDLRDGLTDARQRLLGLREGVLNFGVGGVLLELLDALLDRLLDRLSDGFGEGRLAQEQVLLQVGDLREVVRTLCDTRAAALGRAPLEPLTQRLQLVEVHHRVLYLLWDGLLELPGGHLCDGALLEPLSFGCACLIPALHRLLLGGLLVPLLCRLLGLLDRLLWHLLSRLLLGLLGRLLTGLLGRLLLGLLGCLLLGLLIAGLLCLFGLWWLGVLL